MEGHLVTERVTKSMGKNFYGVRLWPTGIIQKALGGFYGKNADASHTVPHLYIESQNTADTWA